MTSQDIAEWIRSERKRQGLRQEDLANKAGISEKHLNQVEGCKNGTTLLTLTKIITALNGSITIQT